MTKPDSKHKTIGRISYANLGINQLGSVYESLLAYRGFYAEQDYAEVFKAGAEKDGTYLVPASRLDDFRHDEIKFGPDGELFTIPKGTFIYRLNGRDRKKSASFYTPEVLTQSTVKYTLKGFVDRLKDEKDPFCAQDLLKLKILEPAMGAAAFQNEVINQLAELYISQREKELDKHVSPTSRRNEIQRVKAYIATKNVYGVDLNPTAIELGKLSLWLNVIHRDMETPYFGHRIALGNAVIGAWLKVFDKSDLYKAEKQGGVTTKLVCTEWWTKAPHKVHFDTEGKKVRRKKDEIYHFLLPDKNMLGVLSITEQKKANPDAVKRMNRIKKDWIRPLTEGDISKLQKLSEKIDLLLVKFQQYQTKVDQLTGNNFTVWGQTHKPAPNFGMTYEEKQRLTDTRNSRDSEYHKLKTVMDYWCSLWFWEYKDAGLLPTRDEYWSDIDGILSIDLDKTVTEQRYRLRGNVRNGMEDMFSQKQYEINFDFVNNEQANEPSINNDNTVLPTKDEANVILSQYKDQQTFFSTPRTPIVQKLADRYHFFHPMLEFIEVFWLRDGFDIICGNPPWIKLEFDERGIISEYFPEVVIRKTISPDVRKMSNRLFEENANVKKLYQEEETENAGDAAFLNSQVNYPLLEGQQTNLYKCVLENGLDELSNNGFMGLLHPEGTYDDPKGQPLRRVVYHHLRYHFQYQNELSLFAEVHHETKYSENIYGPCQQEVHFASISNLFTPSTVDGCFAHDGHGICGGIKDENGNWNVSAHKDRIVWFGEKELKVLADAFENGADWETVKLTSIHASAILDVLTKISQFPHHVADYNPIITVDLDETEAVNSGIIRRETFYPNIDNYEMVYNGPQFFVNNPCYKNPREECKLNSDYDVVDLMNVGQDYASRSNYRPMLNLIDYKKLIPGFECGKDDDGNPIYDNWIDYYKVGFRKMLAISGERSLICAVLQRRTAHIHGVISTSFRSGYDSVDMAALCSSAAMDAYIKVMASQNLTSIRIKAFPLGVDEKYNIALRSRTLILNCLTKYYADLWQELWQDEYKAEQWSIDDPRLKPFDTLTREWQWATPLRNYFERRQALVEIDVIAAMALGLSLKDLEMIYSIQFPVLQQNEGDTWYDQKGHIVFTCSKGLTGVGCDRREWNAICGTVSADGNSYDGNGEPYTHTIDPKKSELYGGQQVTYYPPYTRSDRIADYRRAWAFFVTTQSF